MRVILVFITSTSSITMNNLIKTCSKISEVCDMCKPIDNNSTTIPSGEPNGEPSGEPNGEPSMVTTDMVDVTLQPEVLVDPVDIPLATTLREFW
jgi:hypothetical protein